MLRSYLAVLRFEMAKAMRAKITWTTILLPVALSLLTVWSNQIVRGARAALEESEAVEVSAYAVFAPAAANGLTLGGIMLLLYASMIVANEGHWKTFKTIMLRPHRRIEWIAGKFSLLVVLAVLIVGTVAGASAIAAGAVGEYGDIAEEGYVIFEAAFMKKSSLLSLALTIGPMIALAAFGLMVSTMTDHTGIATSAALGAYIILEVVKSSMREGRLYLFNTFVPSLIDTSYFQALRGFADGLSDTGWEDHVFSFNIAAPAAWAVLFLLIATVVFARRNFLN